MRLLSVSAVLGALATAATPVLAGAVTYSGSLGGYFLRDEFSAGGPAARTVSLDLDTNLRLSGSAFRPGLLDFTASGMYRRLQLSRSETTSLSQSLGWDASAAVLGTPRSPLHLTLTTARGWSDGWDSRDRAGTLGTSLATTHTANLSYRGPGRPTLSLTAAQTEVDQRVAGIARGTVRSQGLEVSTSYNQAPLSYGFTYGGSWFDGPTPAENFQAHTVSGRGELQLGRDARAFLNENYYLRTPTGAALPESRYEASRFDSGVSWGTPDTTHRAAYSYTRIFRGADLATNADQLTHGVSYGASRIVSKEVTASGGASASLSDVRTGTSAERAAGQSVQGGLDWNRTLRKDTSLLLRGGVTLGVLEPAGQDVAAAYGLSGSARVGRTWDQASGHAAYSATYGSNVGGTEGWAISQSGEASTTWSPGPGTSATATIGAGVNRQYSRVVGDGASRTVTLDAMVRYGSQTLSIRGGLASGIADPTKRSFAADGVFLQPPYDTESRFVLANGETHLARNLDLSLFASYTLNSTVGQANGRERAAGGQLGYHIGSLRISLDERYTVTDAMGVSQKQHRLMLLASRAFGGRI